MSDLVPVTRALISVSDKSALVEFARALASRGVEIISTGGTARALDAAGIPVVHVEAVTGFPEMMDGRLKTLHPRVHGGILALRDSDAHNRAMLDHGIRPIDLVCVNLYPFEATVARPGVSHADAIENIDIGGPAMIRSAAKNFEWVAVLTSPDQYADLLAELDRTGGSTTRDLRARLSAAAFARTARYDDAIARHFSGVDPGAAPAASSLPEALAIRMDLAMPLRYGENPHQSGALYRDPTFTGQCIPGATKLAGKELSYNNINDAAAALEVARALSRASGRAGACVVKHMNPCGAAVASSAVRALRLALDGDPVAAYGGIVAVGAPITHDSLEVLLAEGVFLEVLIAPGFDATALRTLADRKKNLRLLDVGPDRPDSVAQLEFRSIPGGALVQDRDSAIEDPRAWRLAAGPEPSPSLRDAAGLAMLVCRALSSNAVAIARASGDEFQLVGAGAGQMDRVTACRLAVEKAGDRAAGAVAASDAFFPFADGPGILIDAGVSLIAHPGGSKRDDETLGLCDRRAVSCLLSGVRHFRH